MNKKNIFLTSLLVVLAVVYVIYFTDWFRHKIIHISYTIRAARYGAPSRGIFALDNFYKLTEIKVVPLADLQTNQFAAPVWDVVGKPSSGAINHFAYGQKIKGMNPAVDGARPQPLQAGTQYRIFVTAVSAKGWRDF